MGNLSNPLLDVGNLPRFDRIDVEDVEHAVTVTLQEAAGQLERIERDISKSWQGPLSALSDISEQLWRVWGPVEHLNHVKNSEELRKVHEKADAEVINFTVRMAQNPKVYQALKSLKDSTEWQKLGAVEKRLIELRLRDSTLCGVGLAADQQKRFQEIETKLGELSTRFSNHVQDATKAYGLQVHDEARMKGLPSDILGACAEAYAKKLSDEQKPGQIKADSANPDKGPWLISLEASIYLAVMRQAHDRELRRELMHAHISRASAGELDNTPLMVEILQLRREKAVLLGFKNFVELSLASKMAPDVRGVLELLNDVKDRALPFGKKELAELETLAPEFGIYDGVKNWDVMFLGERLKERKFKFTDEDVKPYFPIEQALTGLFSVAERFFGIRVRLSDQHRGLWHDDVRYYELQDESGEVIAGFYLDPFSRPENKRGGAWMNICRTHGYFRGKKEKPVAYIVCNLARPVGNDPSLLTFGEVETLFHEFGHALHHMLSRVDYIELSGTNGVEWDAVELPSMFMENWCYDRPTLKKIGRHYKTGEAIPDVLIDKIIQAKTFRAASMVLGQLSYALTDLEIHMRFNPGDNPQKLFEIQREVGQRCSLLPPLPENRFICAFSHIFAGGSYAAGYYSYLWAEVLACDAFSAFEEVINDEHRLREVGKRYRDTILASGGSANPLEVFSSFRGREPKPDALLKSYGLI